MHKSAIEVLKKIEEKGFKAYLVGGYVRDFCMMRESFDIDICTNAKPKDLVNIFDAAVLPKEKYGAVTLKINNVRFEITTFREELKYENRRPIEIRYTDELLLDVQRRDFTVNSLCMDSNENIIDLFDGKKDIKGKVIRSLGNPIDKLYEDPLRILRAIRFATTLNFKIDKKLIDAIKVNAIHLKEISYERKRSELDKIFSSNNVKYGVKLITSLRIDKYLDLDLSKLKCIPILLGMWAQLDIYKYPFSKMEKETINNIKEIVKNKTISKYEIYKYGLYVSSVAGEILGINKKAIVRIDNSLIIRSKKDINITTKEILELLNKKPSSWLNDLYKDLEIKIINLKLKNDNSSIKDYILKNY